MADNIKIVGNILSTTTVSRYSSQDINLIASRKLQENFGGTNDYIEYYVYDIGGNLLSLNYNYLNYKLPSTTGLTPGVTTSPNTTGNIQTTDVGVDSVNTTTTSSLYPIIEIDPVKDLQDLGYSSGEFQVRYNLFQNKISDFSNEALFVKEISQDRTEIRLASTTLTNEQIESGSIALIDKINNSNYYVDYLLNFGTNEQYVAVNVALNKDPGGYEILFKLYQPLPLTVQEKQTLWIVEEKVNPYNFDINLDKLILPPPPPSLRGPNFNIQVENQGTVSTTYGSYSSLVSSLKSLQSSSYNQIQSLLATQSIDINVDYTDFNDFVFFGSAEQRVKNFYTKVKEIEDYNSFINKYTPFVATTASLQTTINQYSASITNTISQFDGYEYYLYFESSSYAWPKSGINKPFTLLSTGSLIVRTWYNALTGSAETYDSNNYDNLEFAVPAFIRDDENNQPFLLFLNMVGQYFDNIWIYLKAVTDINLANNNLEAGISKDLVYQQLKSLGVKLYNSQAGDSVDGYLVGANTGSSVFDNNFTITGSYLNNIPRKDLVSELYKRIYHNLPLLLKTKGTVAGLDYLMTTFGIPNQNYYNIYSGSTTSSFYTPTGSNFITASILSVNEFGGSLKSGLIKGYNNDKVRIVSNTVTGSVLSSELSLQTFPTASAAFRDDDLHYVDISFSPETQIDTYISKSIAANNPTWKLDDYIGDPRQQYSASYSDLDAQRKLYFETGVGSYPGFTGSLLDYNGFIRLIEYFDNSLFKMLADFVPERASLSTGVTIASPVLERNKAVYSVPSANNQIVYDADYDTTAISAQYGKLYNDLSGDKKPFFTGELSGSVVNVHQYFEDNYNPYEGDWDVYNLQHTVSQSINMNSFLHSDWNVLLNNVSKSVESNIRRRIEYIYGTTGSLTSSAQLQDSYLTLKSYQTSRYEGAKITSLTYNTYTSASYTGSNGITVVTGDNSYGKTAAIDHNSYKVGWINSIQSQSLNFFDKTPVNLKYLVDNDSNLLELNSNNYNVFEVQNIFKSGDPAIISISNLSQKRLDGNKTIWKGGYSFSPIIYRENGESMTFTYDDYISTTSLNLGFLLTDARTYSANQNQSAPPNFPLSSAESFTSTTLYINGIISTTTPLGGRSSADKVINPAQWSYNSNPRLSLFNRQQPNSGRTPNGPGGVYRMGIFKFDNSTTRQPVGTTVNASGYLDGFINEPASTSLKNSIYKVPRTGTYNIFGGTRVRYSNIDGLPGWSIIKMALLVEKTDEAGYNSDTWTTILAEANIQNLGGGGGYAYYPSTNSTLVDTGNITLDFKLNGNATYNLTAGEYIKISFYIIDCENLWAYCNNAQFQFTNNYWGVRDTINTSTQYIYTSTYNSPSSFFTLSTTSVSNDTLTFNTSASAYFYSASFSGSSFNYSPIINNFSVQPQDLFKFGKFADPGNYYEVASVSSAPNYVVRLRGSVPLSEVDAANNFTILRPKPDETSVILEGKNSIGTESADKSILLPFDISEVVRNNVGNIVKSLPSTI